MFEPLSGPTCHVHEIKVQIIEKGILAKSAVSNKEVVEGVGIQGYFQWVTMVNLGSKVQICNNILTFPSDKKDIQLFSVFVIFISCMYYLYEMLMVQGEISLFCFNYCKRYFQVLLCQAGSE